MKATLIETRDGERLRFYALSEPITKGISDWVGSVDIPADIERFCKLRIKPEFRDEIVNQTRDGAHFVVVSDAFTHIERLVFPAWQTKEHGMGAGAMEIDGKHTMMIHGGDPDSVYEDEVYLRHLCILNKLKWEGVEYGT